MKTLKLLAIVFSAALGLAAQPQQVGSAATGQVAAALEKLPLYFIENRGIFADEVAYYVKGATRTLFFTDDGVTIRLQGENRGWVVKLEFAGAKSVTPRGEDPQDAVFSYFKGTAKDWKTGLPTFSRLVYEDLWPGIDLVYSGTVNQLKYEFVVKPGADPRKIRLRYRGAGVELTANGALEVKTPEGRLEDSPPVAFQDVNGERTSVDVSFALDPARKESGEELASELGFRVGQYDRTNVLIIDPAILVYCGYIGGTGEENDKASMSAIAVDAAGNAYVTGRTGSTEQTFPVAVGPDLTHNTFHDAFVAKVSADGTRLVYCGYIGGAKLDYGCGIAVDAAGNAYVSGWTASTEQTFPVAVGPDLTHNGRYDAFVAKVSPQGTALVYCGYLGGAGYENGHGIAVDAAGNAYVTGLTDSTEQTFPVAVGPDTTFNGKCDAFVAKVSADGTRLVYCGYIGGAEEDIGYGIAVNAAGNAYVTGRTTSTEQTFPLAVGPDLTYNGGAYDAFVAKVSPQGTAVVYCGYIGGASYDVGGGIAVDAAGNAYVTGWTRSTEQTFPVAVGPDLTHNGSDDAFVAKVNPAGTALVYCGYLGGSGVDGGVGIAVDSAGSAYVLGNTRIDSRNFPVAVGPDLTHNGDDDAFVAKVNPAGTALVYCGYIGGASRDVGGGIAVDVAGNAYVTGGTSSTEQTFPVRVGPDLTYNDESHYHGGDAFVAKVALTLLEQKGRPGVGATVHLELTASDSAGLRYAVASSFGNGPIPIDQRSIDLSQDDLLLISASGLWPSIFHGYAGTIDATGKAAAAVQIPNAAALVGVRIYTAFVTLKPSAPSGVHAISNTVDFTIEK